MKNLLIKLTKVSCPKMAAGAVYNLRLFGYNIRLYIVDTKWPFRGPVGTLNGLSTVSTVSTAPGGRAGGRVIVVGRRSAVDTVDTVDKGQNRD